MKSNDTHQTISAQLSDYIDDELEPGDRAAIEDHLAGCDECRGMITQLRTIVNTARELPLAPVDRELWGGIAGRIQPAASRAVPSARAPRRTFAFTVPQLAAAGIALMMMSGGLVYFAGPGRTSAPRAGTAAQKSDPQISSVSLADPRYEDAVQDLERTLAEGRGRLDPDTVRVLEQNLATIDRAIAQSRDALEADPGNVFLSSHLMSARQRKLALLRRATALTTGS